jgi:hypothetical protein
MVFRFGENLHKDLCSQDFYIHSENFKKMIYN